ncbi:hypothetical protein DWV06_08180 [Anaerosacchariphilus polymeriproducens]|uniref:TIGR04066 family peptide maturation system protein n=2 Tax=Anaerosacchariphilus polymeriproducens TaxID=1812858 RepID=A0A371AW67_9FIRM|nr:hypothetical protein DWV06_08180 [Anaerosacchariphilus polymeriproducens]
MMIFPYHRDLDILLKYKEMLKDRKIVNILSFPEDQERLEKLKEKYKINKEYEETANELLVLNPEEGVIFEKYKEKLEELKKQGIPLWYLKTQNENRIKNVHFYNEDIYKKRRYSVPVPIIAILGQGINCSKFETLLMTNQIIEKMGYKSLVVSSNELGGLFEFYSYPDSLSKLNVSLEDKIFSMNHYIYDLYMEEKPDLILLEIPGGIMKMGEKGENHFSEYTHVISNALDIDSGIMNLYYTKSYEESYLNNIRQYCFYKYGIEIEMLLSARQRTEYNMGSESWDYFFLDELFLKRLQNEDGKEQSIPNIIEVDSCVLKIQKIIEEFINIYERI